MRPLAFVFIALLVGFAPAPFPRFVRETDPNKSDLDRLQGVWREVRYQIGTQDRIGDGTEVTISGTRMTYRKNGGVLSEWNIALDAKARPRAMQFRYLRQSRDSAGHESIYRLEGDELLHCYPIGDSYFTRPKDFTLDRWRAVVTLRRVR